MLLPGFGETGQRRLLDSTALLLGCGALGSVAADMLARAGVGHLVIVDRDFVELFCGKMEVSHALRRATRSNLNDPRGY